MLPNLSALSTESPMDDIDDPDDPEAAWRAMGVLLYDHLVEHKVPRNPDCGKIVVPAPNPTDKKRKFQEEEPDTECGVRTVQSNLAFLNQTLQNSNLRQIRTRDVAPAPHTQTLLPNRTVQN